MKLSKEQILKVAEKGISGISGISDNGVLRKNPENIYKTVCQNIPNIPYIPAKKSENEAKPGKRENIQNSTF